MFRPFLLAMAVFFFYFLPSAQAQQTGSIIGTVQDQQKTAVSGATATLTNDKNVSQMASTNEQGEYAFHDLVEGTYTLVITASGFKDSKLEGIRLAAGQELRQDINLEIAQLAIQTTVQGQAEAQVETERSEIVGTVTRKELVEIGLNGRNFTQLITLAPGVSNQTGQDEAKVGVQGSVKYSVNGGRVEYNNFEVDGADILNAGVNGSQSTLIVYPSLDAVAEVQVLTSNYGAQYGKTASGTIVVRTKTGGPEFHGDLYYFNRNEAYNARNFFDQTKGAPLYRKNDGGFTLGGPLYIPHLYARQKSKTFFFVSEEARIEKDPTGYTFDQAVPSLAERQGNFNDVCPATPLSFTRTQFPDCPGSATEHTARGALSWANFTNNNVQIAPVAQAILNTNLIPLPNAQTGCNSTVGSCFDATISPQTHWHEELVNADHDLTDKTHFSLHFIHDHWATTVPVPQWAYYANNFPTVQNAFIGPGTSGVATLTQTLSNTLLNQIGFAYAGETISLTNIPGYGGATTIRSPAFSSMGSIFNNGFGGKVPAIAVSGTNAVYGGTGFYVDTGYMPWTYNNPTYTIHDDISKSWGKHTLQFGVLFIIAHKNEINPPVGSVTGDIQGIVGFSNVNNVGGTGNPFADLLLGDPRSFTQDSTQLEYHQEYKVVEPYFQDDWHVTRRLTLNLGLRLSLFGNWKETNGNVYNWIPGAFNPALAATAHVDTFHGELINNATNQAILINLANPNPVLTNGLVQCGTAGTPPSCILNRTLNPEPRIGFAWDPFGKGKTSVRGGYGVFYEHGTGQEANSGSLEGSAPLVMSMTQQYPGHYENIGNPPVLGTTGTTQGAAFPLNVTSIPLNTTYPYVQQWSFGVQQELPGHFLTTLSYVGSKGTHLTAELNLNQLHPVPASLNPFLPNQPITVDTCLAPLNPTNPLSEGFDTVNFHENGSVIGPGDPAYSNLLIACQGSNNLVPFPLPNNLRTYAPTLGNVYSLQNIANSTYHAFQGTLRRVEGPLTLSVAYSYSHSIDDSSDRTDAAFVNSFDLESLRASSDFDERHQLSISYVYLLPGSSSIGSKPRHRFLGGWELSGVIVHQSGTPFSIINGGSPNGTAPPDNAGVANDIGIASFPDLVGNPQSISGSTNIAGTIGPLLGNPSAFAAPRGLTFGNVGRNSFTNPGLTNFDTALVKTYKVSETRSIEFRFETYNTFNHTEFRIYDPARGNVNNTITCYAGPDNTAGFVGSGAGATNCLTGNSFLHPIDAHRPRTIQLGLKFLF